MAIINKFCPKCMNIIKKKDEKCSNCGMLVSDIVKMREEAEKKEAENQERVEVAYETEEAASGENSNKNEDSVETEDLKEEAQVYDESLNGKVVFEENAKSKRHKHKRKNKNIPEYTVDDDGSYNINTKNVTFLEGIEKPTPSVKKARGEGAGQEKLEWWEIYKWADRMLARRKINKEIKKASYKTPEGINKGSLIAWCVFFGWLGIHNFKAGNKKKGWLVVVSDIIVGLIINIPVLYKIMGVFVGGGLGFVVSALWITDLFGLIFNKYKYRISKEEFISNMNTETKYKLPKKYHNLNKETFKAKEAQRLNKKNKKKSKKNKLYEQYEIVSQKMDK